MHKAVFFSGAGTTYTATGTRREEIEIHPETMPALRFLARRGFNLVLVTSERQEYKNFVAQLKDKSLQVLHYNPGEEELVKFAEGKELSLKESYFVTDGLNLKIFCSISPIILVLSGQGFCTLAAYDTQEKIPGLRDVCRDMYAAVFSIALN